MKDVKEVIAFDMDERGDERDLKLDGCHVPQDGWARATLAPWRRLTGQEDAIAAALQWLRSHSPLSSPDELKRGGGVSEREIIKRIIDVLVFFPKRHHSLQRLIALAIKSVE
jgi:hypothetical protein